MLIIEFVLLLFFQLGTNLKSTAVFKGNDIICMLFCNYLSH